jgi:hypothetical protein
MRVPSSVVAAFALAAAVSALAASGQNGFLGKWNITGTGDDANLVYWLEVREEAGALNGMFLNRGGNPLPVTSISTDGDELVWTARGRTPTEFRARLDNGRLVGQHTLPGRGRRGGAATAEGRTIRWVGVRPPDWPPANANGAHAYGTPVVLFDGASLEAFGVQFPQRELGWTIEDGVMTNGDGGNNLVSHPTFTDFKVEAEYRLGEGSNSGIYLRGRYELQVLADYGDTEGRRDLGHMAIYGRTAPRVNASRPAGEWQSMEAVLVGNRVTVTLNGQRVHDNAVIEGITGGALDAAETEPGPIMIQGDHSGVWIRKLVVTPISAAGR